VLGRGRNPHPVAGRRAP